MDEARIQLSTRTGLCPVLPLSRPELSGLLTRLVKALKLSGTGFEVLVVDDAEMARLNERFAGVPGPTNVLAFPGSRPGDPGYLGEIAVSAPACWREAALYGQAPALHLARLLAHALLHLAGYEHGQQMENKTEKAARAAARGA